MWHATADGNIPEMQPLKAYVMPNNLKILKSFKITCKPKVNFAENLNLGKRVLPPPGLQREYANYENGQLNLNSTPWIPQELLNM